MMVLGATNRLSCIVSFFKFYSSGDPLFLGHSPSPAFSANELSLVLTGFRAISRLIRCLQSNTTLVYWVCAPEWDRNNHLTRGCNCSSLGT